MYTNMPFISPQDNDLMNFKTVLAIRGMTTAGQSKAMLKTS